MAGGTGGHVFPALAVAEELKARGFEVEWLGTERGIESELVPNAGFVLNVITISGVRGKGLLTWLKLPWLLLKAVGQAVKVIRRVKPSVVVGFGGFASGPGGIAAWFARKPLVIHEQNAVAGTTNRWLARLAKRKLQAFPASLDKALLVGNPVRKSIANIAHPDERYDETREALRVLVLGGSLGALKINQLMPPVVAQLQTALPKPLSIWHQTGRSHFENTQSSYRELNIEARVAPFIDDMAEAYAWADLVVCRAGALTVAEITAAGVAAFFIPFPYAIDDHQSKNAEWLVANEAAVMEQEFNLSEKKLQAILTNLLDDYAELKAMACRARSMALPNSVTDVANSCEEVCSE